MPLPARTLKVDDSAAPLSMQRVRVAWLASDGQVFVWSLRSVSVTLEIDPLVTCVSDPSIQKIKIKCIAGDGGIAQWLERRTRD